MCTNEVPGGGTWYLKNERVWERETWNVPASRGVCGTGGGAYWEPWECEKVSRKFVPPEGIVSSVLVRRRVLIDFASKVVISNCLSSKNSILNVMT